jgi:hypothetical protein
MKIPFFHVVNYDNYHETRNKRGIIVFVDNIITKQIQDVSILVSLTLSGVTYWSRPTLTFSWGETKLIDRFRFEFMTGKFNRKKEVIV